MNPATIKMAMSGAKTAYSKFQDYKQRRTAEAYDALAEAASTVTDELKGSDVGAVAATARKRLEKAKEEAEKKRKELGKEAGKQTRQAKKKAAKVRKEAAKSAAKAKAKAEKKLGRKKRSSAAKTLGIGAVLIMLVSAAIYVLGLFTGRNAKPRTTPPRVDELDNEPKLVYSTTTPEGEEPGAGVSEEDDDLLKRLEEQLTQMKDEAAEKVGEFKDVAAEKAAGLKEAAAEKAAKAGEKAGELKNAAAEKAAGLKGAAAEKLDEAKEKAADVADEAADKAAEVKDAAAEKAEEVKDKAADKAAEVKDEQDNDIPTPKDVAEHAPKHALRPSDDDARVKELDELDPEADKK